MIYMVVSVSAHDRPPARGSHSPLHAVNTPTNAHQLSPVDTEVLPVPQSPKVTDCANQFYISSSSSGTSDSEPPSAA